MQDCSPVNTPTSPPSARLPSPTAAHAFSNPAQYRRIAGCLQFLTITRPDIAYAVNQICQYMHSPLNQHYDLIVRVLRYLQGTRNFGLPITKGNLNLTAYVDSDWASNPQDRKSTTGYCLFLHNNLLLWKVQKQRTVARSSTEAEYRALASATTDIIWFRRLLAEFGFTNLPSTIVHCDNQSAIALAKNPILQARTKHIEIDQHFVREHLHSGEMTLQYIPSTVQPADLLTKGLPKQRFLHLRNKLTVQSSEHLLAGE